MLGDGSTLRRGGALVLAVSKPMPPSTLTSPDLCPRVLRAIVTGTIQNVLSKATKYAFFDPTKEMAYIPLDQESKVRHSTLT